MRVDPESQQSIINNTLSILAAWLFMKMANTPNSTFKEDHKSLVSLLPHQETKLGVFIGLSRTREISA